jgi:inorganic pyrophosphatase
VAKKRSKGLADPVRLDPSTDNDAIVQVIVETPKGSRNKFAYDPEQRIFTLKRVLPEGMVFPLDFGFLPQTVAADGDPEDVLLIMDEPAFPGIAVRARLIGIMEGEQTGENGKKIRNDRLLAVAEATEESSHIRDFAQLPKARLSQIEQFFVNYHRLQGKHYKTLGWKGIDAAERNIKKARKAA